MQCKNRVPKSLCQRALKQALCKKYLVNVKMTKKQAIISNCVT